MTGEERVARAMVMRRHANGWDALSQAGRDDYLLAAEAAIAALAPLLDDARREGAAEALREAARADDLDLGQATRAARRWLDARAAALTPTDGAP